MPTQPFDEYAHWLRLWLKAEKTHPNLSHLMQKPDYNEYGLTYIEAAAIEHCLRLEMEVKF